VKLATVIKHPLVTRYSPAALRLGLYVGVICASTVVFVQAMGLAATQLQSVVQESIGSQPQRPLPRSDVPNPKVITPPPVAPQGEAAAEVDSVFNSIAELTPPTSTTAIALDPTTATTAVSLDASATTDSFTEVAVPQVSGPMRIISDVTIRAMPENHGHPLGTIGAGELVTAVGQEDGWVQIAQDGNVLGWVYQRFLTAN
jgi:hypothetical protein